MTDVLGFGAIRPPKGALNVLYLGQAGFLFNAGEGTLCVDPYLSNCVEKLVGPKARRMWWNSFETQQLRPDALLMTHDHLDHLDPETLPVWEQVAPPQRYFGPQSVLQQLRRLRFREQALCALERGGEVSWGGMQIKAVYAQHTADSIGFVLRTPSVRIYVTGDTCLTEALVNEDTMSCDVLIACVNGIDGNLAPEEAVSLAERLHARILIPMHYGLIPCSTVSVSRLQEALSHFSGSGLLLEPEEAVVLEGTEGGVVGRLLTLSKEEK